MASLHTCYYGRFRRCHIHCVSPPGRPVQTVSRRYLPRGATPDGGPLLHSFLISTTVRPHLLLRDPGAGSEKSLLLGCIFSDALCSRAPTLSLGSRAAVRALRRTTPRQSKTRDNCAPHYTVSKLDHHRQPRFKQPAQAFGRGAARGRQEVLARPRLEDTSQP